MASLDELFPIQAAERPLRFGGGTIDAAALLRESLKRLGRQQREESDRLLIALAMNWFEIRRVAEELRASGAAATAVEALTIILANLSDVMDAHRIRVEDWTGKAWNAECRSVIDARGSSVCAELQEPRIAYMENPVIYREDKLLARGAAIIETPPRS